MRAMFTEREFRRIGWQGYWFGMVIGGMVGACITVIVCQCL